MSKKRAHRGVVSDGEVRDYKECLLRARCAECGSKLEWQSDSDWEPSVDVPIYYADCCEVSYSMTAHTARIGVDYTLKNYLDNVNKRKKGSGRPKRKKGLRGG